MKKYNILFFYPQLVLIFIFLSVIGFWIKKDFLLSQLGRDESQEIVKVAIYGDSRTNHGVHQSVVSQIMDAQPDLVFHVGDLVDDPNSSNEWATVNNIIKPFKDNSKLLVASGNHEKEAIEYYNNFVLPGNEKWYSYDLASTHFLVLNTNLDNAAGSEQYQWVEQNLSSVDDNKFIVVITHHPFLSVGSHAEEKNYFTQDLNDLLKKHQVDAIFSGHEHNYERFFIDGIHYVVTGGGGAPLYNQATTSDYLQKFLSEYHFCLLLISDKGIEMKVFNEKGEERDRVFID